MGTYLTTGIVQKIHIPKREINNRKIQLENVIKSLQKELDINHYVLSENEEDIFWNINSKMLEENFSEFLQAQFRMYNDTLNQTMQQVITDVKEAKTGEQIIEIAEKKSLAHFQLIKDIYESLEVPVENDFSESITVTYNLLAFFIDGKIIMECYGNILHYFEKNIRLQEKQYPIVSCLKTMITS